MRIAGVKVGKVDEVDLDGDHVKVTFRVKGEPEFGTRTGAAIRVKTILGAKYLALQPKGPGQLAARQRDPAEPDGRRRTTSWQAFSDLTTTTEKVDTARLAKALDTISTTFEDSPAEVRASIKGLSRISRTVASRDQALRELLDHANGVTGVLADRSDDFAVTGQGRRQAVQGDHQAAGGDPLAAEELGRARRPALRPGRRTTASRSARRSRA